MTTPTRPTHWNGMNGYEWHGKWVHGGPSLLTFAALRSMNEDNSFLLAQQFEEYEQQMNRADAERWHGKGVGCPKMMH